MQFTRNKVFSVAAVAGLIGYAVSVWWSIEPGPIEPEALQNEQGKLIVGYATTQSLIVTMETLLDKPGGWLSNDIMPPSVLTP